MKKRFMMILSVMLIALTCAFAAQEMTVTWEWSIDDDPEVNYYRWQINGTDPDGWRIESGDTGEITVKELDPYQSYTLYLQRSYDGINWSETASAEAAALLVEEVPEETAEPAVPAAPTVIESAPAEEPAEEAAPVEEAPAAEVAEEVVEEAAETEDVIGGADEVTEIVVAEEEPVAEEPAEEEKPSRFEVSLLVRPGAALSFNYDAASKVSSTSSALTPFAIGLDFANIVSNDSVGFGVRLNIDADAYANNGWGSFFGSPKWNPLKWEWKKMFDIADSYTWALDTSVLAMFNARAGIADFNIGLGGGAALLLDVHGLEKGAQLPKFHFQNVLADKIDLAAFADLQLGARFYLGDVVSLGLEADYKAYIPNYKMGDLGVNAILGFTF